MGNGGPARPAVNARGPPVSIAAATERAGFVTI